MDARRKRTRDALECIDFAVDRIQVLRCSSRVETAAGTLGDATQRVGVDVEPFELDATAGMAVGGCHRYFGSDGSDSNGVHPNPLRGGHCRCQLDRKRAGVVPAVGQQYHHTASNTLKGGHSRRRSSAAGHGAARCACNRRRAQRALDRQRQCVSDGSRLPRDSGLHPVEGVGQQASIAGQRTLSESRFAEHDERDTVSAGGSVFGEARNDFTRQRDAGPVLASLLRVERTHAPRCVECEDEVEPVTRFWREPVQSDGTREHSQQREYARSAEQGRHQPGEIEAPTPGASDLSERRPTKRCGPCLRSDDPGDGGGERQQQPHALVEGRIETDSVEVHIPDRLPPDVVDLAVVEEGAPLTEAPANGERAATPGGHRMSFDLTIDIPRRAFIRGRGIDSEWAGKLKVSGTADEPVIKGKLDLVRGQVTALGKTFRLDRGSVEFLGTASIDPDLSLVARRETDDLDVTISASGPLSNPALAFSSVPELPEDEIISQVLFGKSTSQLGAIEAAQLAASVAELTGQAGGAGGILGRVRSTLGVDVLQLESSEADDSSTPDVAAGKYLTDDVYIGAKQGAEADSGSAEVEVELTPNISIESEVGQQGQSEVGVKLKWDY